MIAFQSDYQTAVEHAGLAHLETGVLTVTGRDRAHWLHKLVTADVEHLAAGQGVRGALLDAKGHFVADLIILVLADSILLLVAPEILDTLLGTLRRYIFREKVKVDDQTQAWGLLTIIGNESDRVLPVNAPETAFHFTSAENGHGGALYIRSTRAQVPSTDVLVPTIEREKLIGEFASIPGLTNETLEVLRVEAGQPRWGIDFDSTTLALEIPEVFNVRVDQGCYVGQEVVARIVHRGHVNRHLVGLKLDGSRPATRGATILQEVNEIGSITSAVVSPRYGGIALGYVKRQAAEPGTRVQVADDLVAQVVRLPFSD